MHAISIVIPVYNRATLVKRTLESVLAQSFRPLQVVLVDNDSTDGSYAVLQQFASMHSAPDFEVKVVTESHHTAGAARNRGAHHATGRWLMFFDSDDEMHPHLAQSYAQAIDEAGGEVDVVSVKTTKVFGDDTKRELPFYQKDIIGVQLLHSQLATQRYIVRKDFFEQCHGWNVDLPVWNDWELGMRLLLAGARVAFIPQNLVTINHTSDSITGDNFAHKAGQWEHSMDVVEQQILNSGHPQSLRLRRLLDFKRITLAAQYQAEGQRELSVQLCRKAFASLHSTYGNSLKWRLVVAPIVKILFARIAHGKRGSALVARYLL